MREVNASDRNAGSPGSATGQDTIYSGARIKLVADNATGRLLIRIDGRDAAFIDAQGLNIQGNLRYGGGLQDYGDRGFADALKPTPEGAAHAR